MLELLHLELLYILSPVQTWPIIKFTIPLAIVWLLERTLRKWEILMEMDGVLGQFGRKVGKHHHHPAAG